MEALGACAQITCQMVAEAIVIETEGIEVETDKELVGSSGRYEICKGQELRYTGLPLALPASAGSPWLPPSKAP